MNDYELDAFVDQWVHWCMTRRLFAPTVKSNILARFQPAKRRIESDGPMLPEMPFFNMAVHALCEMPENTHDATAFLGVHWYAVNIKALAADQQCARGTVYNRARRFASRARALGHTIRRVHEEFMSENCPIKVEQNHSCVD